MKRFEYVLGWLLILVGISAIGGGAVLAASPDGELSGMQLYLLARSPFTSFLIPGLVLGLVIGVGSVLAGISVLRKSPLRRLKPVLFCFRGWRCSRVLC